MAKFTSYETDLQAERRKRDQDIIRDYLDCAADILSGRTSPNLVFTLLGKRYQINRNSVMYALKKAGVYLNASVPVNRSTSTNSKE